MTTEQERGAAGLQTLTRIGRRCSSRRPEFRRIFDPTDPAHQRILSAAVLAAWAMKPDKPTAEDMAEWRARPEWAEGRP